MASWIVRLSSDGAVRVRALAEDIILCTWAIQLTLTVPLSTGELLGVTLQCTSIPSRECIVTRSRVMLRSDGPLSSYTHLTLFRE